MSWESCWHLNVTSRRRGMLSQFSATLETTTTASTCSWTTRMSCRRDWFLMTITRRFYVTSWRRILLVCVWWHARLQNWWAWGRRSERIWVMSWIFCRLWDTNLDRQTRDTSRLMVRNFDFFFLLIEFEQASLLDVFQKFHWKWSFSYFLSVKYLIFVFFFAFLRHSLSLELKTVPYKTVPFRL